MHYGNRSACQYAHLPAGFMKNIKPKRRHIKYKMVHLPCAKIGTIQKDASNTNNPNHSIVEEAKFHGPTVYLYYVRMWHYKSAVKHVSYTIWMCSYVGHSP